MAKYADIGPFYEWLEDLKGLCPTPYSDYETLMFYEIEDKLDDLPEIVQCKACKHWLKDVPGCTDAIGRCRFGNYMVGAAGYCVYGERKDNESSYK